MFKRHAPHQTSRTILLLTLLCCALLAPTRAQADPEQGVAHKTSAKNEGATGEREPGDAFVAAMEEHGLEEPTSCLAFESRSALLERRRLWEKVIFSLAREDPEMLHGWLVGKQEPPAQIMHEAIAQRDCMFSAIVADAAAPESDLTLDYGDTYGSSKRSMQRAAKKYAKKAHFRAKVAAHFSRSHYRDAAGQAFIWYRKFNFSHPRSFNLVSPAAGEKCGFRPGQSWKPDNERHQRCWSTYLTRDERQREILTASSAPGISRHHWGTEFDLYGLNPRRFVKGQRLHDEYVWMKEHAITHGFFQPFTGPDELGEHTYIEERWHWSYYPIAQALIAYIEDQPDRYEEALMALWGELDARWVGKKSDRSYFSYVKTQWRAYVVGTARLKLALLPSWIGPSSLAHIIAKA